MLLLVLAVSLRGDGPCGRIYGDAVLRVMRVVGQVEDLMERLESVWVARQVKGAAFLYI